MISRPSIEAVREAGKRCQTGVRVSRASLTEDHYHQRKILFNLCLLCLTTNVVRVQVKTVRATTLPHGVITVLLNEAECNSENYRGTGLNSYENYIQDFLYAQMTTLPSCLCKQSAKIDER